MFIYTNYFNNILGSMGSLVFFRFYENFSNLDFMVSSSLIDDSLLRLCCPDQGINFEWVKGVIQWMVCAVTLKLITHFIYHIIKGCKKPNPVLLENRTFHVR